MLKSRKVVGSASLVQLGRCRPDSDIDVGLCWHRMSLILKGSSTSEEILEVLTPLNNHPFDLIILNYSSAIFAYKVLLKAG